MRHPVLHPPFKRHAAALQVSELAQPRVTVWQGDRDVADRRRGAIRGGRWQAWSLYQCDVVVVHLGAAGPTLKLSNLGKSQDLRPEPVRLFDVPDVDDQMIEA